MRKIIIGVLLFVLLIAGPAESQEEFLFYLPLVSKPLGVIPMAGNWSVIEKESTTNLITNPSFELGVANWTVVAGGIARSAGDAIFGVYGINDAGLNLTLDSNTISLANGDSVAVSMYIEVMIGSTAAIIVRDTTNNIDRATTAPTPGAAWARYTATWTNTTGGAINIVLRITTALVGGDFTKMDAAQMEEKDHATTYCDGDQDGCEWNGGPHASTSTRSGVSLAGGRVREFEAVYKFFVDKMIQIGVEPLNLAFDEYAILPGGELNAIKSEMREFVLAGTITGTSLADLHVNRQALLEVLHPDVPGGQPIRLRYDGAAIEKEIKCYYMDGLDGDIRAIETGIEARERIAVRFMAADPFFYEIEESAAVLDNNDTATLRYIAGRLKSTGQWDDLGLAANPAAGGTIVTICYASDKTVYVGGNFTNMNGSVGRDYIARYIPLTDTWETVGAAGTVNSAINAIVEGPDGVIYIGGSFTNVGDANGDMLAKWNGAAWSSLANTNYAATEEVRALAFDHSGNLIIGGYFNNFGVVGAADGIAGWNGAAFYAVGAPALTIPNIVYAIGIDSQDNYYFGGAFTNLGGVGDADNLGWWNGTAYAALGGVTPNAAVYAIAVDSDDTVVIGGTFTDLGGDTDLDYLVRYTGTAYVGFGIAPNLLVQSMAFAPDGTLYIGGNFTTIGGLTLPDRVARWVGDHWAYLDVDLPGTPIVYAIGFGTPDPVVPQNYDIYIGFSTTGAGFFSGLATVTNDGTQSAYPYIKINRSGGTSAILYTIRNETTGKELLFDAYALLDGETLTIYLEPTEKRVVSDFFGPQPGAVLPNSDFGEFSLVPGGNDITIFIALVGPPTMETNIIYKDTYASLD